MSRRKNRMVFGHAMNWPDALEAREEIEKRVKCKAHIGRTTRGVRTSLPAQYVITVSATCVRKKFLPRLRGSAAYRPLATKLARAERGFDILSKRKR